MKYNIISFLNKDLSGNIEFIDSNINTILELYIEVLNDILKEYNIKENINILFENNTVYIESDKIKINSIFDEILNSDKLIDEINLININDFEEKLFNKKKITKEELYKLNKQNIYYTILTFHISDRLYKKLFNIYKFNNKLDEFYNDIIVEKENFFLRIAKNGLKNNFSKTFNLAEFSNQKINNNYTMNNLKYNNHKFLTKKEKKMLHTLNCLQYLQDEKNNYTNYIKDKYRNELNKFYTFDVNNNSINKFIKTNNNYFIINKKGILVKTDKDLFSFLKYNKKIYEINLTNNRFSELNKLVEIGSLRSNEFDNTNININKENERIPRLLVINTTSSCNMNCSYCYNNESNTNFKLSSNKVTKSIRKIQEEFNLDYFNLVFHGGEPLLELEEIKKIITFFKENNSNFKFGFQTNGLLINNDLINYIKKNKASISLSLDGPEEINIKSRANKKIINKKIEDNIGLLNANDIKYTILCTLNQYNIKYPKKLITYFNNIKCNSVRFNTLIPTQNIKNNNSLIKNNDYINFFSILINEYLSNKTKFKILSIEELINTIKNNINRKLICNLNPCGAGSLMLNINGNGDITPCGELSNLSEFKINYKDYINSNLKLIINKKFKKIFIDSNLNNIEECKNCKLNFICTNGCFGKNYFFHNYKIGKNPYCELQKFIILKILDNYNEIIEKEVNVYDRNNDKRQ